MDATQLLEHRGGRSRRFCGLLLLVWLIGVGLDRLWLGLDYGIPNAAQSYQLNQLWQLTQSLQAGAVPQISHPLMYGMAWLTQRWLGDGLDQLLWIQAVFNGLLLVAVYGLGQQLLSRQVGLWAAGCCVLLPALLSLRLEFSLDLPLVAMVMVSLWQLRAWQQAERSPAQRQPRSASNVPGRETVGLSQEELPWETELQQLRQTIVRRTELRLPSRSRPLTQRCQTVNEAVTKLLDRGSIPQPLQPWLRAISLGLTIGLALMTDPLALIYLMVPFAWSGLVPLLDRRWWGGCQWVLAGCISWLIAWPWYRLHLPELVLSALRTSQLSSERLTAFDGSTLIANLVHLTTQVFYPLLLAGSLGLCLYHQRVFLLTGAAAGRPAAAIRLWRRQVQRDWVRSVGWLLVCITSPLVIAAWWLPLGKVVILPVLPLVIILLTQGLLLFPGRGEIRWFVLLCLIIWSISNFFPLLPLRSPQQLPQSIANWPQQQLLETVAQANPELHQTIGILPQTAPVNADYLTYLSHSLNLSITAKSVGTDAQAIWQDRRALPWYVLQTGNSSALTAAQRQLAQAIRQDPALQLEQRWNLPDGSELELWRRPQPAIEITPIIDTEWLEALPLRLEKVIVPPQAQPGTPIPIVYEWTGRPQELQTALVEVTWRRVNDPRSSPVEQWWHDHGIGLGQLQARDLPTALMQVTERTAMLAPAGAAGQYRLEVAYLDPVTGMHYALAVPDVRLELVRQISSPPDAAAVPELDLMTQLRLLARTLAQQSNIDAWRQIVGRLDRYDPTHSTLLQWQDLTLARRAAESPDIQAFYDLALVEFLQGEMSAAIAGLQQWIQRQPDNPQPSLYVAIAEAAMGNGTAAQVALARVRQLQPDFVAPASLQTLIAAVQGNPLARWRLYCLRLDLMSQAYRRMR